MDLLSDLVQAVQDDLTVGDESTLYNEDLIKRYINRARRKAYGLYRWPELEDAKKTSTREDYEYYDYPTDWQADSIWKIKVDGEDYGDPLIFRDFLYEKDNDWPSGLTKSFSSQWRRFFLYPIPTTTGDNNIEIWGQKTGDALEDDSDTTIFSYSLQDGNEAIVLETVAMLKSKGDKLQEGQFHSLEAKQLLSNAWNKIRQNQQKYESTTSFFSIPDFFGKRKTNTRIGDF